MGTIASFSKTLSGVDSNGETSSMMVSGDIVYLGIRSAGGYNSSSYMHFGVKNLKAKKLSLGDFKLRLEFVTNVGSQVNYGDGYFELDITDSGIPHGPYLTPQVGGVWDRNFPAAFWARVPASVGSYGMQFQINLNIKATFRTITLTDTYTVPQFTVPPYDDTYSIQVDFTIPKYAANHMDSNERRVWIPKSLAITSGPLNSITIPDWDDFQTGGDNYYNMGDMPNYSVDHYELGGISYPPAADIPVSDIIATLGTYYGRVEVVVVYKYLISVYYWSNTTSYYNVFANFLKKHDVDCTIPLTIPISSDGYPFMYWYDMNNSKNLYLPGDTYSKNAPLRLRPEFREFVMRPPEIISKSAYRCDADGNSTSSGHYVMVTVNWRVYVSYSGNSLASVTGIAYTNSPDDEDAVHFTFDEITETGTEPENLRGVARCRLSNINRYKGTYIQVTVTDTIVEEGHRNSTTAPYDSLGSTYLRPMPTTEAPVCRHFYVNRCDSSGSYDYRGNCCRVEVQGLARIGYDDENHIDSVVGRYREYRSGNSFSEFQFTQVGTSAITQSTPIGTAAASTWVAIIPNIANSGSYEFEATVSDAITEDPNHVRSYTSGNVILGAVLPRPFTIMCAGGGGAVQITGTMRYCGYFNSLPKVAQEGENRTGRSYNEGHHSVALFDLEAHMLSGTTCVTDMGTSRVSDYETVGSSGTLLEKRLANGETVSWEDGLREMHINNADSLFDDTNHESAVVDISPSISWDGANYTAYTGNHLAFSCPRHDIETARFILYQPMLSVESGNYVEISGTPVGIACPANESIRLTYNRPPAHPVLQYMEFWHWNTLSDNLGDVYDPTEEVSWASLANKVSQVTSERYRTDGGTVTISAMWLYSIWNPLIRYYRHSGTSVIPDDEAKHYNETYHIPATIPVRSGYVFLSYNTDREGNGTTYMPSGTIAAGQNTSVILYPQWRRATKAPTINRLTAVRCDAYGNEDALGSYCKVTVGWSVDRTYDPANTGTLTGVLHGETDVPLTFSSGASGESGTATIVVADIDTESQYTVEAIVTDTNTELGHVSVTTRTVILTSANFVLDLRSGGTAIGIGSAAPQSGLRVGWDTQIDGDLNILGNLTVRTMSGATEYDIVNAAVNFNADDTYGYVFGPIRTVCATINNDYDLYSTTSYDIGTVDQDWRPPIVMGFANQYGRGYVDSNGVIHFSPDVTITADSDIYVTFTFVSA